MNIRQILRIPLIAIVVIIAFFCSQLTFAESNIKKKQSVKGIIKPIQIEVAASVLNDTKFEKGIFLFNIYCALDSCIIERLSLNECVYDNEGKSSFRPKTHSWASWAGFLEATLQGDILELDVYQAAHHALPAKIVLTFDYLDDYKIRLKSFKATGFVDLKKWPDTDTRIEYAPFQGDQAKQLDCPVFLPGIK